MAVADAYVSINHDDELSIKRGIAKPEDKAVARKLDQAAGQGGDADEPEKLVKGRVAYRLHSWRS
jgi:hypothetical protein